MIYDLMALGVKRLPGAECDLDSVWVMNYYGPRWWAKTLARL